MTDQEQLRYDVMRQILALGLSEAARGVLRDLCSHIGAEPIDECLDDMPDHLVADLDQDQAERVGDLTAAVQACKDAAKDKLPEDDDASIEFDASIFEKDTMTIVMELREAASQGDSEAFDAIINPLAVAADIVTM